HMQPDGHYIAEMEGFATIDRTMRDAADQARLLPVTGAILGLAVMVLAVSRPFAPLPLALLAYTNAVNVAVFLGGLICLMQSWLLHQRGRSDAHKAAVVEAEDDSIAKAIEERVELVRLLLTSHPLGPTESSATHHGRRR